MILAEKFSEAKEQLNLKATQITAMQNENSKLEKFYVEEIKKCINEL
jgi:hypothetical protein